jgi:hypothetical protein
LRRAGIQDMMGGNCLVKFMSPLLLIGVSALALIAALGWLFLGVSAASSRLSFTEEWWRHFRPERYLPLGRLLGPRDVEYLRTLPGYSRAVEREFRRNRLKVCRELLLEMELDFDRLLGVAQALLTAGRADPALADELLRQRLRFKRALWRVRLQMLAYRAGWGQVDVSALVDTLTYTATAFRPTLELLG